MAALVLTSQSSSMPSSPLFLIKNYDGKKKNYHISHLNLKTFIALMETSSPGKYYNDCKLKDVNILMVYNSLNNKNSLLKKGIPSHADAFPNRTLILYPFG